MAISIKIDNKTYTLRATARSPKLYRALLGRDMLADMQRLVKVYQDYKGGAALPDDAIDILNGVVWLFAKQGGSDVGASVDDWLDKIEGPFALMNEGIMAAVATLWAKNMHTTATPKKK